MGTGDETVLHTAWDIGILQGTGGAGSYGPIGLSHNCGHYYYSYPTFASVPVYFLNPRPRLIVYFQVPWPVCTVYFQVPHGSAISPRLYISKDPHGLRLYLYISKSHGLRLYLYISKSHGLCCGSQSWNR